MTKQKIKFRDPVVQSVVNKFVDRSDVGFAKYGKTLRDDPSDVFEWLTHLQEELMDATLYLQRLKEEITTLREEKELLNSINDIDVIDASHVTPKKKITPLEESCGRGDNVCIKKFPSISKAPIRYYWSYGFDNDCSIEIDD